MKISESKVPYSLGLEQVSGPLGSQREHFVGMMGPEQDRILPCELNLLPHNKGLFRSADTASDTLFLQRRRRLPLT